jgi:hypothetical protein
MKNLFKQAIKSSINFVKKHKTIIINIGALVGGAAIGVGVDKVLTSQKKPEEKTLVVVVPVIKENQEEKEAED